MMLKLKRFSRTSTALAAVAAAVIAGSAHAGSPAPASRTVPYGDLNLASEQGANTLSLRVASAARQVCGADDVDMRNLQAFAAVRACESQAITRAVHDVRAPQVAARLAALRGHG